MKKYSKQKVIQLKLWYIEKINGKYGIFLLGSALYGHCSYIKFLIRMIIFMLKELYRFLPDIINFLEFLVSTLSYYKRRSFFMDYTNSILHGISNKKYLSELLGIKLKFLRNIDKYYSSNKFLKKSNGKTRELYNPNKEYKKVLKKINKYIFKIGIPCYAFGGIPKLNYVDNASKHLDKRYLLLVDISNFFPSTNASYVYDFFYNKLNMAKDIAKIMMLITTEDKGSRRCIPQGYPTSPLLSLFSYIDMFEEIDSFSKNNNLTFSVYYDDITLSSNKFIDPNIKRKIIKIIKKYNLEVNSKKTRLVINKFTNITGVIVSGNELKAPKKLYKKLHENYIKLSNINKNNLSCNKENLIKTCRIIHGCMSCIKVIDPQKNMDMYLNKLLYIQKCYNISIYKKA